MKAQIEESEHIKNRGNYAKMLEEQICDLSAQISKEREAFQGIVIAAGKLCGATQAAAEFISPADFRIKACAELESAISTYESLTRKE
jgi:hypothetical protein